MAKSLEASLDDFFVGHLLLKPFPDFHGTEGATVNCNIKT